MSRFRNRTRILLAIAVTGVLGGSGLGPLALADEGEESPGQHLGKVEPGPFRFVRAEGLDAEEATPVFSLANGDQVAVISDATTSCVVKTLNGSPAGETCAGATGVSRGHAITVADECGSAESNRMEIVGLAPVGAASVRLTHSDGSSSTTRVVSGAFRFEGTNPAPGERYPTGVEWLDAEGTESGSAPLPVNGDDFCLPSD